MATTSETIPLAELIERCRKIAAASGMDETDALIIVEALVNADIRGVTSHGLVRLAPYIRAITEGHINPRPCVNVEWRRGATARLDGDNGLGQIGGHYAMREALELAALYGIGMAMLHNTNHTGMLGHYAQTAAEEGMIGFCVTNGPAVMAPWNGADALLSNNPFAWGVPGEFPIVFDVACSVAARGRIRAAAKAGDRLPDGWALDAEGNPTTDPISAMSGTVLPFGGHKGYGLAVINEVLAGVLPGALLSFEISKASLDEGAKSFDSWRNGMLCIAISPAAIGCESDVLHGVGRLRDVVSRARSASGERVLLPGQLEWESSRRAESSGLAISADLRQEWKRLELELGVANS